mgnify:CR=1 FL=1
MPSERVSDSFREIAIDGVSADVEAILSEWRSRTAYGKVRILPIVLVYPLAAGGMIVAGSAMWVLFSTLELAVYASESVRGRCDQMEPEVYKNETD